MKVLYSIEDKIEEELKTICKKPDMSTSDVEMIYKMIDILKDISTINAMKEAGYSERSYDDYSMRYAMDNYGNNRGSYDNSYRRGRDSMGRYTSRDDMSRDGYSGHDKSSMVEKLKMMMREATSEKERENYRDLIDHLEM